MNDRYDQKLDALLSSRPIEPARADLADRIIQRAQAVPQKQALRPLDWLKRLFDELYLRRPAYTLAAALVAGLVIGFAAQTEILEPNRSSFVKTELAEPLSIESFLYADEDLL